MNCIRNETCHMHTFNCCYSCEIICSTNNGCNDDTCVHHPNHNKNVERDNLQTTTENDIKWLLEELLKAGRYTEVDFDKITEIAKRNGYEIDEDLDLVNTK